MFFSMLVETQGNVSYSWILSLTNFGDCWIAIEINRNSFLWLEFLLTLRDVICK